MSLLMVVLAWLVLLLSTFHVHIVSESSGITSNHHQVQPQARVRCIERERLALLTFKQGLHHDQYHDSLASWTSNKDCCSWTEIRCDNLTNHVITLDLFDYGIGGLIGPSLLQLQYLEHLDLHWNYFTQIPKFIGSFKRLKYLDLSENPLSGTIPTQLGNLTKLQYLSLGNIQMIVDNLEWLSHLSSLSSFKLYGINFTKAGLQSFSLPSYLLSLELSSCNFPEADTSSLPHTNSSHSLRALYMSYNSIHSTTFNWLLNSSVDLVDLSLDSNYMIGVVNPFNLRYLSKLKYLYIYQTIVDSLEWLSHLSSLTTFTLGYANFTKHGLQSFKMPPSLSSLKLEDCQFPEVHSTSSLFSANSSNSLTNLELRSNTIHSAVLAWLFNSCANLVELAIIDNFIDGSLPNSFWKMTSLVNFQLTDNTGLGNAILNSLGNLTKLKTLDLSDNNFNGLLEDILESLSGCPRKSLENLYLGGSKLRGSILYDDKTFLSLRELYLNDNFNGSSRFPNLVIFHLDGNQLTELPDFTTLPSLREFSASNNRLNGSLPESIGQLHNLEFLDLSSNSLSGVVSEVHFQKLSNLKELDLSSNSLTLSFNSNWVPPFQLNILSLSSCKLGPHFPRWLRNQLNLSHLDISNSGISGAIPNWFSKNTLKVEYLDLSSNLLNSTLPNLLMMSYNQPELNLSSNEFHGSLPSSLSNASKLYLSNNKLSGLRSFLCDQKNGAIRVLDLSSNMLSGSLLDCLWNFKNLFVLILENNELSGKIPSSITFLRWLSYLNLRNNHFSGSFPSSLKNCTKMQVLDVGENDLIGKIPSWIGENMMNLVFLSLKSNRFYGTIPSTICKLQFLQIMDLSINNISGAIPACIDNLTSMVQYMNAGNLNYMLVHGLFNQKFGGVFSYATAAFITWKGVEYIYEKILGLLRIIDLSSNGLTGEIPKELGNLIELVQLNLSRNNLTGAIPKNIGNMSKLESLDLSHNDLSGIIPVSLAQISTLDYLDLSNNKLSGRIPTSTQLQSLNASSYIGNLQLCGQPLTPTCPGDETSEVPSNSSESYDDDDNGEWYDMSWLRKGIGVGFAVGFFGVCGNLWLITTFRLAYFRFMDNMGDWLYVVIVVKWAVLKRRFST